MKAGDGSWVAEVKREESEPSCFGLYEGKRIFVTGGTGLIGRHLVERLLLLRAQVTVVSLDSVPVPAGCAFLRGDLREFSFCKSAVSGQQYVFHLAGIKGSVGIGRNKAASFMVPHLQFNTNVMEASRLAGVERFLYTSSIGVYPPAPVFREDEAWSGQPHEADRYAGWAKRIGELQAEAYRREYGWCPIAIVRPANVFGPGDNFDPKTAMVVPALIARVASGERPLSVWGNGKAVRDFIYADDVARGMMLALALAADGTPINLGSGEGVSIRTVAETIASQCDDPPQIVWDTSKPSGEDARVLDMSRARSRLGFECLYSFEEGIERTVKWYRDHAGQTTGRYNVFCEVSA